MTDEQQSIEELAECIKELIRIIKIIEPMVFVDLRGNQMNNRIDQVYKKASNAKNRINI